MNKKHFKNIINGYSNAPINQIFKPKMKLSLGQCEIEMKISKNFHHSANSLHGSIYFKMLDDAAFFAAQSVVEDYMLLTASFNITFRAPVPSGWIKSIGRLCSVSENEFHAEAKMYDSKNEIVAFGDGIFKKSKISIYSIKD